MAPKLSAPIWDTALQANRQSADTYGERLLEDFQALLARADLALYEAKRAGRARWHTFEGTEPLDAGLPAAQPSPALLIGRPAGATRYRATRPDLSLEAPAGTL